MDAKPKTFGPYVLTRRIAVGGMAEVFRAVSFGVAGFEKVVAIKRLLPHISPAPRFVRMFINEAKVAACLGHGNIVQILDLGSIDGQLYLAMEYVNGKDLSQLLARMRRDEFSPPVEMCCYVAIAVLDALNYAHTAATPDGRPLVLVHRDVSPPNILLSFSGEVKLADFGIAKVLVESSATESGVLKGKFSYMSPEQASGKEIDPRSDVFSTGACLYELLTRRPAFDAETIPALLKLVRNAEVVPPRKIDPAIPPRLEQIVMKALSADPNERYRSAAAFREDLEKFMMEKNYHCFSSWLADFLKEVFAEDIEAERKTISEEVVAARNVRPSAETMAKAEMVKEKETERLLTAQGVEGNVMNVPDEDENETSGEATVMVARDGQAKEPETAGRKDEAKAQLRLTQPTMHKFHHEPEAGPVPDEKQPSEEESLDSILVRGGQAEALIAPKSMGHGKEAPTPLPSVADLPEMTVTGTSFDAESRRFSTKWFLLLALAVLTVMFAAILISHAQKESKGNTPGEKTKASLREKIKKAVEDVAGNDSTPATAPAGFQSAADGASSSHGSKAERSTEAKATAATSGSASGADAALSEPMPDAKTRVEPQGPNANTAGSSVQGAVAREK